MVNEEEVVCLHARDGGHGRLISQYRLASNLSNMSHSFITPSAPIKRAHTANKTIAQPRARARLEGTAACSIGPSASGWPVAAGTASGERDAGTSRIEPPSESVICPPRFISAWLCQRLAAPGGKVPKLQ